MKIVGKIFAVLYCIFFTLILFGLVLTYTATSYLKADFFTTLITSEAFMETKLSALEIEFEGKEEIIKYCGEDCTVEDAIVIVLHEELEIDEKLVKKALKDEDIKKALGEFASIAANSVATGKLEKINYKDYEKLLKKDVVKEIMKELEITESDVKNLVKEYNDSVDEFNKSGGMGGAQVESVARPA